MVVFFCLPHSLAIMHRHMFTVAILQRATVKRPNIIIIAHEQVLKFHAQPKLVHFPVLVLVV